MTPQMFWHITPRKFTALCSVHADLNDPDAKKNKKNKRVQQSQTVFVDQLSFL